MERVKKCIEDMRSSLAVKKRLDCLKRVEKIINRLDVDEKVNDAFHMKQLEKL